MRRNGDRVDPEVLRLELERATVLLEADGAWVRALDDDGHLTAHGGWASREFGATQHGSRLAPEADRVFGITADRADAVSEGLGEPADIDRYRACLYVPLRIRGLMPDAVLVVGRHHAGPWTRTQIEAAHEVAARCTRVLRERTTAAGDLTGPIDTPDSDSRRILLVEDEVYIVRWLERHLLGLGHEVVTCPDAESAIAQLRADPDWPHAIVVDLRLPDGSGVDVFRATAGMKARDAQWVVMTGAVPGREIRELRDAGARVVHKPFTTDELCAALGIGVR